MDEEGPRRESGLTSLDENQARIRRESGENHRRSPESRQRNKGCELHACGPLALPFMHAVPSRGPLPPLIFTLASSPFLLSYLCEAKQGADGLCWDGLLAVLLLPHRRPLETSTLGGYPGRPLQLALGPTPSVSPPEALAQAGGSLPYPVPFPCPMAKAFD
jgi:hypothetical protein